ncbi:hypothetical protein QYF61_022408 [Mycteria americana]|uniref:Keratin n=1 Tax=Mycteria americana TaxID=33587 RepID=A0AAN7MG84_MYCAM|nr:hypothetical protein QYF61_022408 [Mycteria americana]
MVVTLPRPILSSFPQNTHVGSSTSAAVGSILSCDGVPITSGCCDLSGTSSHYYGRRYCLAPNLWITLFLCLMCSVEAMRWTAASSAPAVFEGAPPSLSDVLLQPVPSPVVVTLASPILSSFPQNTIVGSSTSAAVGSILSCDGVPINSACCDISCVTSLYCGSRCPPC